jgi:hypothetical protein
LHSTYVVVNLESDYAVATAKGNLRNH